LADFCGVAQRAKPEGPAYRQAGNHEFIVEINVVASLRFANHGTRIFFLLR